MSAGIFLNISETETDKAVTLEKALWLQHEKNSA